MKYWKIGITGGGPVSGLESKHLCFRHGGSAKRVLQLRMLPRISMQGHCHGYCRSGERIHEAPRACDGPGRRTGGTHSPMCACASIRAFAASLRRGGVRGGRRGARPGARDSPAAT